MSSSKVLLGVIAGVAAGAAIGILFAPEKGSDTRKNLLAKGEDYFDELKDQFMETVKSKFDMAKDEVQDLASKGKAKYDHLNAEVSNHV